MKVYVVMAVGEDDDGDEIDIIVGVYTSRERAVTVSEQHWESEIHEFTLTEGDE